MRGRKPKPTHLRLVGGNAGKRPINRDEPVPPGALLDPPAWMTDDQKMSWRYAIAHAPMGLLRMIDQSTLTTWVVAESFHREATQQLAKSGMLVKAPNSALPIQSPYLPIVNKQAQIMLKAASELGFTPSSRTRVSNAGSAAKPDNPFLAHGRRP